MNDQAALAMIHAALLEVAPDRVAELPPLATSLTIEALELDSVTTMEMIGVLEERLDSTFPDEELPKVNTLGDIVSLIRGQKVSA